MNILLITLDKYDIIFIDGLHVNEQVYRDIQILSIDCIKSKGAAILMHDCLPLEEDHQIVPAVNLSYWNGDVWKAFVRVRNERTDVEMSVIDTDTGVGLGFIHLTKIEKYLLFREKVK